MALFRLSQTSALFGFPSLCWALMVCILNLLNRQRANQSLWLLRLLQIWMVFRRSERAGFCSTSSLGAVNSLQPKKPCLWIVCDSPRFLYLQMCPAAQTSPGWSFQCFCGWESIPDTRTHPASQTPNPVLRKEEDLYIFEAHPHFAYLDEVWTVWKCNALKG